MGPLGMSERRQTGHPPRASRRAADFQSTRHQHVIAFLRLMTITTTTTITLITAITAPFTATTAPFTIVTIITTITITTITTITITITKFTVFFVVPLSCSTFTILRPRLPRPPSAAHDPNQPRREKHPHPTPREKTGAEKSRSGREMGASFV